MNLPTVEVPADGSCLFCSVALAYLHPVVNNPADFKNRFEKLFGRDEFPDTSVFNHVYELLKASNLYVNTECKDCYNDATLNRLVSECFRHKIIDTLRVTEVKSHLIKSITLNDFRENRNEEYVTSGRILTEFQKHFKHRQILENIDYSQLDGETVFDKIENILQFVDRDEKSEFLYEFYLKCMTENKSSWERGHRQLLLAMSYSLQCEMEIETTNGIDVVKWNDSDCKVQLVFDGSQYSCGLNEKKKGADNCNFPLQILEQSTNNNVNISNKRRRSSQLNSGQVVTQPSTNVFSGMKMEYDASGLDSLFHGPMYQVKLLLLYLKRAHALQLNFRLATEWKEAEKFDDLVFLFQDKSHEISGCFLQAKHRKDEGKKPITYKDLTDESHGDFSLKKYFISYLKMKNNPHLSHVKMETFIIITNIDFDKKSVKSKQLLRKIKTAYPPLKFEDKFPNKTPTRYHLNADLKMKEILGKAAGKNSSLTATNHDIDEFFKKLVFAVEQPNEVELGQVLEREVSSSFNLYSSKDIADQIQRNLLDWFKKKTGKFITPETGKAFFENAERMFSSRVAIGLNAKYETKLKSLSEVIKFNELNRRINTFLNDDKFYVFCSEEPLLTLINIYQCIVKHETYKTEDSHFLIELFRLLKDKEQNCILNAFGAVNSKQVLVIYCKLCSENELRECDMLVKNLLDKLFKNVNKKCKKVLLVVGKEIDLPNYITSRFSVENDATSFDSLSGESRDALLEKSVKFQGNVIKLGDLCEDRNAWNEILSGKIITELITMTKEKLLEIGSAPLKLSHSEAAFAKVFKIIEPQNLLNAVQLNSNEKQDTEKIFLFTENCENDDKNNDYFDRFKKIMGITTKKQRKEFDRCSAKFDLKISEIINYHEIKKITVILNGNEETNLIAFKKICSFNSKKFVYWLEIIARDKFHWLQVYDPHFYLNRKFYVQKDVEKHQVLHRFRARKKMTENQLIIKASDCISEETLANTDQRVVLIVAEPGMGKSTTLTRLSEYKLNGNTCSWVFRFNLRDCEQHLLNFDCDYCDPVTDVETIAAFLLKLNHDDVNNHYQLLTRNLLKHSLQRRMSKPVLILFDGYDEINKMCQTKLVTLMKYLQNIPFVTFWISSRKEHAEYLKENLDVPAIVFKKLVNEREEYLRNYYLVRFNLRWSEAKRELVFRENSGKFDLYFKALLKKLDEMINQSLSKFMGIPLQLRLLAEGFLPEFEKFIDSNTCSSSEEEKAPEFKNLDLLQFYRRFIDVKYEIYFLEKTKLSIGLNRESKRWLTDHLHRLHQRVALKYLFPGRFKHLLRSIELPFKNNKIDPDQEIELRRVGILQVNPSGNRLQFIHQTFAEYFVAQFLLEKMRENTHSLLPEAIQKLLLDILKEHNVICMFLKEQITEEDLSTLKWGYIDKRSLFSLNVNIMNYNKLLEFLLSFYKNKIWVLRELDLHYFLSWGFASKNATETVECLLKFTQHHYDVVRKYVLDYASKEIIRSQLLRDAASDWPPNKKANVGIIMKAIKCYPKIIEEVTRDYYLEDLCDLFENDEELCRLLRKLRDRDDHDDAREINIMPYEVEANQLLRDLASDYESKAVTKMSKNYNRSTYANFSKKNTRYNLKHIELEYFKSKPYKMREYQELQTLEIETNKILIEHGEETMSSPESYLNSEAFNKPLEEKILLANLTRYKTWTGKANKIIDVESVLKRALELVQKSDPSGAIETLKLALTSSHHHSIANLWFNNEYNNKFQQILNHALKNKQQIIILFFFDRFKSHPIISAHLFSLIFYRYPEYRQALIDRVECEETKDLLSHLLNLLDNSLNDKKVKQVIGKILLAIEQENYEDLRNVIKSVEKNAEDIIETLRIKCEKEVEFKKILIESLQFISKHGQSTLKRAFKMGDLLFIERMVNCMKHFPQIFHFLILNVKCCNVFGNIKKGMFYFNFELVRDQFPKTACCLALSLDKRLNTPFSYALKKKHTKLIGWIFDNFNSYPNVLKHLILTPNMKRQNHNNCLRYLILKKETKILEWFLGQLNKNVDAMENVIHHFVVDEKDKLSLYEIAMEKNPDSLLIFLNSFKCHVTIFTSFFLPVDKNITPAFCLAGALGCKEVMDVLLRVLKSELDVLWPLLIWANPISGKTVLHSAAERGYKEIVDALLSSVRKQKRKLETLLSLKDKNRHTALDCAVISEVQIVRNDFNVDLRCELMESEDYKNLKNNFGNENSIKSVEQLSSSLKNIPMVVNLILIMAKIFNNVELMLAMFENEELRLALESMNVTKDEYSYSLYYSAIKQKSLGLVKQLIDKKYDVNCTNGYGYTPLMKAIQMKNTKIIRSLVNVGGADIYVNNMNGKSAFSMALDTNKSKIRSIFENK